MRPSRDDVRCRSGRRCVKARSRLFSIVTSITNSPEVDDEEGQIEPVADIADLERRSVCDRRSANPARLHSVCATVYVPSLAYYRNSLHDVRRVVAIKVVVVSSFLSRSLDLSN
jgi:hypothetical protein